MALANEKQKPPLRAKDAPPETYLRVAMGYGVEIVLPLEDGLALMACFAKAEKYVTKYIDSRNIVHIGGSLPEIHMGLVSGTDYMTGKLNGEAE
jgi:hypothetical protein